MQRSRKALLKRRAFQENAISGRKHLYKVSLSVFIVSWVFVFLLISLVSRGNSYQDEAVGDMIVNETWHKVKYDKVPDSRNMSITEHCSDDHHTPENYGTSIRDGLLDTEENRETPPIDQKKIVQEIYDLEVKEENIFLSKSDKSSRVAQSSRVAPPRLDEFKSKAITSKYRPITGQASHVVHRLEPGGKEYNYASASKGAKVLASNKEAKGAFNILDRNKDKYLRNPCSTEDKYIIIELSEETLVATIEVANFEHYSSNLKDFELLSSLTYPTDSWVKLGNFTAINAKHAQKFALQEPKWARYLRLNLLSHYGSEFYCTLSVLEVYGVDAVEKMLEDLISDEDNRHGSEEPASEQPSQAGSITDDNIYRELLNQIDDESIREYPKQDLSKTNGVDSFLEARSPQAGRIRGDTVLKILMQKVRLLDINSAIFEQYLDELNGRYGHIFKDIDNEIAEKELLLEKMKLELQDVQKCKDVLVKDVKDLFGWKSIVSSELDRLVQHNVALRSEVETVRSNQVDLENRGLAVIFISFIFCSFAAFKLVIDLLMSMCRIPKLKKFGSSSSGWLILMLSSSIVTFVLVL